MISTGISSVRSKMAPASCKRRTTRHLVNASTLPWIMLVTGGPSHNTLPMLRRKNGEPKHRVVTEQAAQQSLEARGGSVFRNLLGAAEGAWISRRRVNSDVRR